MNKLNVGDEPMPTAQWRRAEDPDAVELRQVLGRVWMRKGTILLASLLIAGAVALALSQVTPRFTAVAKIMLDPRERRVVSSEEVVSSLDLKKAVIESEVGFISSSVLLEAAVSKIGSRNMTEYDPVVAADPAWRRWAKDAATRTAGIVERAGFPQIAAALAPAAVAEPADAEHPARVARRARRVVGGLRQHLEVYQEGESYIIGIRISSESANLSAQIVNSIADSYIESQLAERADMTRRATAWLETRTEDLRTQVAAGEEAVERHRAEKLNIDGGGIETAAHQLSALSSQLAAVRAARAEAEARRDQIRGVVQVRGLAAAAEVLNSPLFTSLREQRAALLRQDAELETRYDPANALRVGLRAEIGRLDEQVAEEVSKIIEGLENEVEVVSMREQAVAADLLALEERVAAISLSSIDLRHLEREAEALRNVYESFLTRLMETRAQDQLAHAEARVIEHAQPAGAPTYPRTKLLVGAGAVAGAGLGLGLVMLLEFSGGVFRSGSQVSRETGLPVLAALTRQGRRRSAQDVLRALVRAPLTGYGEEIRRLRTALLFGTGDDGARSIVITSSLPDEGKTSTTLMLAYMTARSGKRVLVIDFDLRQGTIGKVFGSASKEDFAAFLRGSESLERSIVSHPTLGFDILATPDPIANIADMVAPARLRSLVSELRARYDVVLIDAPPLLSTSDARVIARSADALVYVVRWGRTPVSDVLQGLASLRELGVEPQGIVMTMVGRRSGGQTHHSAYPGWT